MSMTCECLELSMFWICFLLILDNIADRGEKLELLVDKTEELNANVSLLFAQNQPKLLV